MNKKLLTILTSFSLMAIVVSGCDNASTSSDGKHSGNPSVTDTDNHSGSASDSKPTSPSESTPSSSIDEEEYAIVVAASGNSTVTVSATKAVPGTVIELTITPEDGYRVDKITLNGTALTNYYFAMPNSSAVIRVYTTLENKDGYIIDGDVSARLIDEGNGIYVARNVTIENDSYVYYSLGSDTEALSSTKINVSKSFADIGIIGTSKTGGFTLGGNAIYDFYYDSNDLSTPCYIQRVGVLNLPSTETMVEDLFSGEIGAGSTLNPANVNKVEYYSSIKNEQYVWELYSNNSSYATIVNPITKREKAIVYKAQDNNVYRVVDNYLEGAVDANYVTRGDTTAYSGQYDIVKAVSQSRYQRLQSFVDVDANSYSHSMESLDADFYSAYRNGYVGNIYNDVDVDHGEEVTSTRLPDGGFTTLLKTWVRWANSSTYSSSTGYASAYITYEMDLTFTAAGAIKEGTYVETIYGTDYYDFASNSFKAGYEAVEPKKECIFSYSYGNPKEGQPTVDVSKYFTQSISDITVNSSLATGDDTIAVSEDLKASVLSAATSSNNLTFICNPSTALDAWQYGPVSSSNTNVIVQKSQSMPYDFRAVASGSSDITIGNHTSNANSVTAVKTIHVADAAYIKSIFMYTVGGYPNYDETFDSAKGIVYCGNSYEIQLAGTTVSGNYVMKGLGLTFTMDKEGILELSYNDATGRLTIDATKANVTEQTSVKVTAHCPVQLSDWPESSFTYYVMPAQNFEDSLVGTYKSEDSSVLSYVELTSDTEGIIYAKRAGSSIEYHFTYSYDNSNGKITATLTSSVESNGIATLKMFVDDDGALCVYFVVEIIGSGWDDITTYEYLGYLDGDDEYYEYQYDPLFKQ